MSTSDITTISIIATRIELLHEDFGEMKGALKEMANAISKIALVEERQQQAALAQERTFKGLEKLESRLDKLEQRVPLQERATRWIENTLWGAAGLAVLFIVTKLNLI